MLLLLGIAQTICGIGFLITPIYFDNQQCDLFIGEYGIERKDSTAFECSSLIERVPYYLSTIDAVAFIFISIFFAPTIAGIIEIIYAVKRSRVVSSSRYFVILTFLSTYPVIVFFLWFGFMDNNYYVSSRCPVTYDKTEAFCSLVIKNYNLMQSESLVTLIFTVIGIFSTTLFLKRTYERIGQHETVKE